MERVQLCCPCWRLAGGEPFDSPEYLFEVKWNGIRALASRPCESQSPGGWDLWGRHRADYRVRYPEMQVLAALPPGTTLDGELVLMPQGLPDLEAILARHQITNSAKIQHFSRQQPVTYVVFDLLAHEGRSLLGQPLQARRALLQELLARYGRSHGYAVFRGDRWPWPKYFSSMPCDKVRKGSWPSIWPAAICQANVRPAGSKSNRRGGCRASSSAGNREFVACAVSWWRRRGVAGCSLRGQRCVPALPLTTGNALPALLAARGRSRPVVCLSSPRLVG